MFRQGVRAAAWGLRSVGHVLQGNANAAGSRASRAWAAAGSECPSLGGMRAFHGTGVPFAASGVQAVKRVPNRPGNAVVKTKYRYTPPPPPTSPPWTPTRLLKKRRVLYSRMECLMRTLDQEACAQSKANKWPEFRAGDILELKIITPENNRRQTTVKGICIARRNRGIGSMFTIRNIIDGVGVERSFPLHCPDLLDLKIIGTRKVRRAKLYYLRDRKPAESRV
mmetsp:Transcript_66827/g.211452  ORF Transcript_66827/g.211452 Transcript_66827/m.211452 type:complete len:224 (-) Transcript_66827:717-1388(-)